MKSISQAGLSVLPYGEAMSKPKKTKDPLLNSPLSPEGVAQLDRMIANADYYREWFKWALGDEQHNNRMSWLNRMKAWDAAGRPCDEKGMPIDPLNKVDPKEATK